MQLIYFNFLKYIKIKKINLKNWNLKIINLRFKLKNNFFL
jgi:hypothetical protein